MVDQDIAALIGRLRNRVSYDWRDGTQVRGGDPDAVEAADALERLAGKIALIAAARDSESRMRAKAEAERDALKAEIEDLQNAVHAGDGMADYRAKKLLAAQMEVERLRNALMAVWDRSIDPVALDIAGNAINDQPEVTE